MTRSIESAFQTAIEGNNLKALFLLECEFDSGNVYLWTGGTGEITWDSKTYTGAGSLLTIDPAEEVSEIEARNAAMTLRADDTLIALAQAEDYQGRPCRIRFAALDSSDDIITDPLQIFAGQMDQMPIEDDPKNPVIALTVENNLAALRRSKERRYTSEDQKLSFSGDLGLDGVTGLQDDSIPWGS